MAVNIGPKLPLPQCFKQRSINSSVVEGPQAATKPPDIEPSLPADVNRSSSAFQSQDIVDNSEKEHIVLKIYTCQYCAHKCTDLLFHEAHVTECLLKRHNDSFTPNGFYCCKVCAFKFRFEYNLLLHMEQHTKHKSFHCYICKSNFETVDDLRDHCKDEHKAMTKVYSCNICEYSSMSPVHLKEHIIKHNSDKQLHCYHCRRNYEDTDDFDKHYEKVHKRLKRRKVSIKGTSGEDKINYTDSHKASKTESFNKLKSEFLSEVIYNKDVYFCNGCKFTFTNKDSLMKHKNEHLKVKAGYRCSACNYETLSLFGLKKHTCDSTLDLKFQCNVCGLALSAWKSLRHHVINHVYDKLYCSICKTNFDSAEDCQSHRDVRHNKTSRDLYTCTKCSFTHNMFSSFKMHMTNHMRQEYKMTLESSMTTSKSHSTPVEKKSITTSKDVNSAINNKIESVDNQSELTTYQCSVCKLAFESASTLRVHDKTHKSQNAIVKIKPITKSKSIVFTCSKCGFKCPNFKSLTTHNKSNHGKRNVFPCSGCEFKSYSIKLYIEHVRSHTNNVPFSCLYCIYVSRSESEFEKHVTEHSYKFCPMCVYKTTNHRHYREHVLLRHKPGSHPFRCSECPYTIWFEEGLSMHMLKFHPHSFPSSRLPLPKKFQPIKNQLLNVLNCKLCPFRSSRMYDLKRHLTKHFIKGCNITDKNVSNIIHRKNQKTILNSVRSSKDTANVQLYYKCSQCLFKSKWLKSVSLHLKTCHNIIGGVKNSMILKVPLKIPSDKKNAGKILKTVKDTKLVKPSVDSKQVKSVRKKMTSDLNHKKTVLKCSKCDIHKCSSFAQMDHRRLGHKGFWNKPYSCKKCGGMRFSTKSSFERHNSKHDSSARIVCELCKNYVTYRSDLLLIHQRKCTVVIKSKTKKPKDCIKNPSKDSACSRDREVRDAESDDESYSCGECDYVTTDVTALTTHMFIHSGIPDD